MRRAKRNIGYREVVAFVSVSHGHVEWLESRPNTQREE